MVSINYIGRFGNNLFQYVFGRLLAVKNGLALETEWNHSDMIKFAPNPTGERGAFGVKIDDQHRAEFPTNPDWLDLCWKNKHVMLKGYFQHPHFYDPNKKEIKSWMFLPALYKGHEDQIALHLRLDDYDVTGGKPIISPQWYAVVLSREENRGKKVFIIVEKPKKSWEIEYMEKCNRLLGHLQPLTVSQDSYNDFHLLRSFGTIITSNSSFAWWAAFLSEAKRIYTFERWLINSPFVKLQYAENMIPVPGKYIWEP
jgi:hypothetical protein